MKSPVASPRTGAFPRAVSEFDAVVVASLSLPFLAHLLPAWGTVPLGAVFLPMFFAPLLAVLCHRAFLALTVAALAPWLNHVLTGHPVPGMAILLTFELLLFTGFLLLLARRPGARWWTGPVAYLLAKPVSGLLLLFWPALLAGASYGDHLAGAVTRSWPGLLALAAVSFFALRLRDGGAAPRVPHGKGS